MTLPIDSAKVDLPLPKDANATTTIVTCRSQSTCIRNAEGYPNAKPVQEAVEAMDTAVDALSDTVDEIDQLRAQLAVLEGTRERQLGTVRLKHDGVKTALDTASNNDPQAAAQWTGKTQQRKKRSDQPVSKAAPEGARLQTIKAQPGSVKARCDEDADAIGYVYQTGSNPKDPDQWPAPSFSNGHTYTWKDLPIGQTFYARIAVVRRGSVQGAWSPVLEIMVR